MLWLLLLLLLLLLLHRSVGLLSVWGRPSGVVGQVACRCTLGSACRATSLDTRCQEKEVDKACVLAYGVCIFAVGSLRILGPLSEAGQASKEILGLAVHSCWQCLLRVDIKDHAAVLRAVPISLALGHLRLNGFGDDSLKLVSEVDAIVLCLLGLLSHILSPAGDQVQTIQGHFRNAGIDCQLQFWEHTLLDCLRSHSVLLDDPGCLDAELVSRDDGSLDLCGQSGMSMAACQCSHLQRSNQGHLKLCKLSEVKRRPIVVLAFAHLHPPLLMISLFVAPRQGRLACQRVDCEGDCDAGASLARLRLVSGAGLTLCSCSLCAGIRRSSRGGRGWWSQGRRRRRWHGHR
mmetsp:Transcript_54788/g.116986  ORF Transcript_54788/g.116986 Transcript_54788/m.116986 type:complete len:347 (-) Transcript_54788:997-2037(-)